MNAFRALFVMVVLVASAVALPGEASAHQPRLPIGADVTILDPEVSKAYYATLDGRGHTYRIRTAVAFDLYVSLTVPDISGQGTDISAVVVRVDGNGGTIGTLNGVAHQWTKFFEPFGFSDYLQGPEYRGRAEPGDYEIRVTSPSNDRKYVLVVGEIEAFDFKETVNALDLVPLIKRDFFGETPATFFFFPWGLPMSWQFSPRRSAWVQFCVVCCAECDGEGFADQSAISVLPTDHFGCVPGSPCLPGRSAPHGTQSHFSCPGFASMKGCHVGAYCTPQLAGTHVLCRRDLADIRGSPASSSRPAVRGNPNDLERHEQVGESFHDFWVQLFDVVWSGENSRIPRDGTLRPFCFHHNVADWALCCHFDAIVTCPPGVYGAVADSANLDATLLAISDGDLARC